MHEFLSGFVAASLIPFIAFLLKVVAGKILQTRTKEIIATDDIGKKESFFVPANARSSEIFRRVEDAYSFEAEISRALENLQATTKALKTHSSKQVDFVVELPVGKVALEAKLALDRVDANALSRYLMAEAGLRHLLLVSRSPPSQRFLDTLKASERINQVSFLTVPGGADAKPLIEKAVTGIANRLAQPTLHADGPASGGSTA